MPIKIYEEETFKEIDWICDDNWNLPSQIFELKKWLADNLDKVSKNKSIADIGFMIRDDASRGGAVIDSELIQKLNHLKMEIYLSEYK